MTGAQHRVAAYSGRTPELTFPVWLRLTAARTAALVGRSIAASRAYDSARDSSSRRAALREFVGAR